MTADKPPKRRSSGSRRPTPGRHRPRVCPIVGVGASAGGLEAFSQLLEHLPDDTGMAYVFVQHLDPQHASLLTELLARKSHMPVTQVIDETAVAANHVYVIPPNTCRSTPFCSPSPTNAASRPSASCCRAPRRTARAAWPPSSRRAA